MENDRKKRTILPGRSGRLKDNRGAAMVLVLCVMLVFITLTLTMLASAANLMGNAKQDAILKRCQVMAVSLSDTLKAEMLKSCSPLEASGTLQGEIRVHIDSFTSGNAAWTYYTDDGSGAEVPEAMIHTYTLDSVGDEELDEFLAGGYSIKVEMYWQVDDPFGFESASNIETRCSGSKIGINVICSHKEQSYKVRTMYRVLCTPNRTLDTESDSPDYYTWEDIDWTWSKIRRN